MQVECQLSALTIMLMDGPHKYTKTNVCVCVGVMGFYRIIATLFKNN